MLAGLSENARAALLGAIAAALAFLVFRGPGERSPTDPADAVPKDSFLVATADLAGLRRSPIHDAVLGKDGLAAARGLSSRALALRDLAEACGFDPLSRVDKLALAVPEEGDTGEIGLAARVTVTRDELERCTKALAASRGGAVATRSVGSFVVAENEGASSANPARPRLAYGSGGLLVVGRGAWFDAMLDAAMGQKPGLSEAKAHADLRASLTRPPGFRSPTILVTAILPRSLRDRLRSEMSAEVEGSEASRAIMAGVLGVSAVGVAVQAGGPGGQLDLAAELVCDDAASCAAVEKLILKKRLEWSKELSLRMVGLGPLLDSLAISMIAPAHMRVTAGAGADPIAATFERILRLRARAEPPKEADRPPPGPAPTPFKDETLRAKDAGADR